MGKIKKFAKRFLSAVCAVIWIGNGFGGVSAFAEQTATDQPGYITVGEEKLPVYALHKAGNDNENFNILFLGDGYTKNEQTKLIEDVSKRAKRLLETEPFSTYAGKINVYAVPTVSQETGVSIAGYTKKDTYFSIAHSGSLTSFTGDGESKARAIRAALENTCMDADATIGTIHILSNAAEAFGTSTTALFSFAGLHDVYSGGEASVHEIAHSIGRLRDEYGVAYEGVNASRYNDPNVVQWKKMLGFRGIGIINNENSQIYYIPSRSCIMMDLNKGKFCEVCKMELVTRLNDLMYTKSPEPYHVADPDITTEHSNVNAIGQAYEACRINENNIETANGKDLEFRTIIQNFTNTEKRFQLSLAVTGANGEQKGYAEKTFVIAKSYEEDGRKSVSVTIPKMDSLVAGDKIAGKVIDLETNKVVATDQSDKRPMCAVNIHHKLKSENGTTQPLPNAQITTIYVPQGTLYQPKRLRQVNGYLYEGSNVEQEGILLHGNSVDIDFYYVQPPEPKTNTTVAEDGKTFTIQPQNINPTNKIILALYDGNRLVEGNLFSYVGSDITYKTEKNYTSAQVIVLQDLTTLRPVCKAERMEQEK